MKKIIAGVLALSCLASAVFAQVKVTKEAKAAFDKTIQIDPKTKKPYNFGGIEIQVTDWWSNKDYVGTSDYEVKQAMWRQWVCDTYNVKIYQDKLADWGDYPAKAEEIFKNAAKKDKYYVVLVDARSIMNVIDSGLAADLGKVTTVNFNDKQYNQTAINKFKKGKSFYSFGFGNPEYGEILYYNKQIIRDAGFDGDFPYNLQKLGKWNWKNFELLLNAVTKDNVYGISYNTASLLRCAVLNNGGLFVTKNNDGTFSNTSTDSKVVAAGNWAREINNNYGYVNQTDQWDEYMDAFVQGKSAFLVERFEMYGMYRDQRKLNQDVGMVVFPVGPNGGKTSKVDTADQVYMIPAAYNSDKVGKIVKAYELYYELNPLSPEWVPEEEPGWNGIDKRFFKETYKLLPQCAVSTYDNLIPGINTNEPAWYHLWKGSKDDYKDVFAEKKAEWDEVVKKISF